MWKTPSLMRERHLPAPGRAGACSQEGVPAWSVLRAAGAQALRPLCGPCGRSGGFGSGPCLLCRCIPCTAALRRPRPPRGTWSARHLDRGGSPQTGGSQQLLGNSSLSCSTQLGGNTARGTGSEGGRLYPRSVVLKMWPPDTVPTAWNPPAMLLLRPTRPTESAPRAGARPPVPWTQEPKMAKAALCPR